MAFTVPPLGYAFDVAQFQIVTERAQQDDELARCVLAGQVARRVRFGIAVLHRFTDRRRERAALLQAPEHIGQRSRQHRFEAIDAIAGAVQVAQRCQQRQLGADRRAVVQMGSRRRLGP